MTRLLSTKRAAKFFCWMTCFFVFFFTCKISAQDFGYICYCTKNIGDDIQSVAAKRFLPENGIGIDREFVSEFYHDTPVHTIMNGWYMYENKSNCMHLIPPQKPWPPSSFIDPLLISMYFTNSFISTLLSPESINYLKTHGPVGARDHHTLEILQNNGIPSYFSGCLTLTLENTAEKRGDKIYLVDLPIKAVEFIKARTNHPVKVISHTIEDKKIMGDRNKRLEYAEKLLQKYARAKCVITTRLHATLPCLALETPVLVIKTTREPLRWKGIDELVRNCSVDELLSGEVDFDFNEPTENSKAYLPIREKLIKTVKSWVASKAGSLP